MSHFGRSGPPDIRDTYSLLVLNISFKTSADDLFPLFDRYGKVVDIFIPRDRRSGDSRGFGFIRYKHSHEAQKAIDRLDGRNVDGRNISVQFAKYGREMETIRKGKITRENFNWKRSRSRSPRRSRRDDHYHGIHSSDWHDQDRHPRHERVSSRRYRSCSYSPSRSRSFDRAKGDDHSREDDRRNPRRRTPDRRVSPQSSRSTYEDSSSPSKASMSPAPYCNSPQASVSPAKRRASSTMQNGGDRSRRRTPDSRSQSASLNSDAEDR